MASRIRQVSPEKQQPNRMPLPVAPVRVSIGGQNAEVVFAGSAPETVGVLQINVTLPEGITGNAAGVLLTIGDATSQNGVGCGSMSAKVIFDSGRRLPLCPKPHRRISTA
jgi:uncharacterized protein (TIGR03437 family)